MILFPLEFIPEPYPTLLKGTIASYFLRRILHSSGEILDGVPGWSLLHPILGLRLFCHGFQTGNHLLVVFPLGPAILPQLGNFTLVLLLMPLTQNSFFSKPG